MKTEEDCQKYQTVRDAIKWKWNQYGIVPLMENRVVVFGGLQVD